MSVYRKDLDIIKGFAILAVVLYHIGIAPSGYLGVDVFFVINGFFIVPKVLTSIAEGSFKFFPFLEKRVIRLLPMMLLATAIVLSVGFYGMLPDDYENLCESVVAANCLSGNILGSITAKNYWDVWNEYKPLMHTWYIGILFQFYLFLPLLLMLLRCVTQKLNIAFEKSAVIVIVTLTAISFVLYLSPSIATGNKFYLLPCRFYELAVGGLAGLYIINKREGVPFKNNIVSFICIIALLAIMLVGTCFAKSKNIDYNLVDGSEIVSAPILPQGVYLIATVTLSYILVSFYNINSMFFSILNKVRIFGVVGIMSYSIYMWHQPILAFYRYYYSTDMNALFILSFIICVLTLSYLTYNVVEKKVLVNMKTRFICLLSLLVINGIAFAIYLNAGVVRDVPELEITKDEAHRNIFAEYNDRIRQFDKNFEICQGKINVLCIGNSFARDWCNILLESNYADKINLSYSSNIQEYDIDRIKLSDFIFYFGYKEDVPLLVKDNVSIDTEVWGIGTKNFGDCNGQIYVKRKSPDYFSQTVRINPNFFKINDMLRAQWEDKYVDLLQKAMTRDSSVVVFSDDHLLLSQDGRHLTHGGAKFFAKKIDFAKIFDRNKNMH